MEQPKTNRLPRWLDAVFITVMCILCIRAIVRLSKLSPIALPLRLDNPLSLLWLSWLAGAALSVWAGYAIFSKRRHRYAFFLAPWTLAPLRYAIWEGEWGSP